jgi:hypothetical protein
MWTSVLHANQVLEAGCQLPLKSRINVLLLREIARESFGQEPLAANIPGSEAVSASL